MGTGITPKLKDAVWERVGDDLLIMLNPHEVVTLEDPAGQVELLISLLAEGTRSIAALTDALRSHFPEVATEEVESCIADLDSLRMLERAEQPGPPSERYFTNFVFFNRFATLREGAEDFQRRLRDAHVLILGMGGLGSNVLMHLVGVGVGRVTIIDHDTVELRNFSRQFLFRASDIGRPKVLRAAEWVHEFGPETDVIHLDRKISSPDGIAELLPGADLVIGAIDTPPLDISYWINSACVAAGVPHVRGGMGLRPQYYSVDPGRSACVECDRMVMLDELTEPGSKGVRWRLMRQRVVAVPNPGVGPIAGLIGSAVALEAIRYITRFTEPVAAGVLHTFDLASGGAEELTPWLARPDCPVCAAAGTATNGAAS